MRLYSLCELNDMTLAVCPAPSSSDPPRQQTPPLQQTDSDREALFKELVEAHSSRLHRFIIKHIGNTSKAEDLAQEAFAEAARSYQTFRGESQLSTWLYGIALNLVRNYLSRAPEYRYDFVSDETLEGQATAALSPAELAEQAQSIRMLHSALEELPDNMRDILLLVGLDGVSYEEAAVMLTVPIGTVRSRLSRARTALRERLEARGLTLDF